MTNDEANAPTEASNEDDASNEPKSDRPEGEPDATPTESEPDSSVEGGDGESNSEADEPKSVTDVETVVVDPEDVIRSVAYNGQEDIGRKGKAVFSLTPPFGETVEPTIRHLEEDSREGKADDEIHIRPFRFVVEGRQVIDQRPTRRLAKSELEAEEPSEAAIEAWIDEAMEAWKAHLRENLTESVDIYSSHGMAFIDVEYRENE